VPEPSSIILLAGAILVVGIGFMVQRLRNRRAAAPPA
jgi:hypothetical protein